jgi:hypothetical protein
MSKTVVTPDVKGWRDHALKELEEKFALQNGGGGGNDGGMEARVSALEKKFDKIESKLDSIGTDMAYIKGKIEGLPSAATFGELKGRVDSLPTTAKVATIIGIAAGLVTILTRWADIIAILK